jgi:hypothetical protein
MTATTSPASVFARPTKPKPRRERSKSRPPLVSAAEHVLASYADLQGRPREVLTQPGACGSHLVIDRDRGTFGDWRLVAHLAADEPLLNAELVCHDYLSRPHSRWCRPVVAEDLCSTPFDRAPAEVSLGGGAGRAGDALTVSAEPARGASSAVASKLIDREGRSYRLQPADTGRSIPELRWHRLPPASDAEPCGEYGLAGVGESLGVREAIGALESYEPLRSLTVRALARHCGDPSISTYALRAELERLDASRIVLNRGLREAVVAAIAGGSLSMSEITIRCGRVKRRRGAPGGGDTSWLARRVGLMPEGGRGGVPTPWVHSEVLALIARRGLGISPREVELG